MQAVIQTCGFPLAAPSANPANQLSPTNASHVRKAFDGLIPLIVDGGQSKIGLESTVLDLTCTQPRLLRPGMIHAAALQAVLGDAKLVLPDPASTANPATGLRSPGMLPKHYAPRAKLVVLSWRDVGDLAAKIRALGYPTNKTSVIAHTQIPPPDCFGRVAVLPREASAFAQGLYAQLHQCDEPGTALILVEAPPQDETWRAIADRLTRASQ
jgi:L-threonylcarbamoyladenylate synthase